ncbi:NAD(P)H-dependent glycerol-3-phosphate dehydrogenase [Polyangium jinanense]|uniref:Glycerol-3-phosphate dehydrogenase [NAD(P)+] n=1 Tax=Polyangium jinanense TaxID=2829994 RepID=A0A9X3X0B6_9BACT|nr:NAD(P)H-dependent glycerol-3-phosphate dehydrogenase [Polyangium jinanense]MDC3953788.1 NAD(P)-dependent glycerol-3-phosphate dehydrogenase [Polyangium jinanense]MDC3979091.1 NAD(P)-dependent glycerol-3-phosphate dehydrogenase [Polyangium jinanense]
MSKVAVLGAGAWGTALAKVLADKQNPTFLWSHREELALLINERRVNERYLPSAPLPPTLRATGDLEEALAGAELVVLVVPSHAMREVVKLARPYIPNRALICSATKGIENDSLMLMSEVLVDELGRGVEPRLSYLSGPSFAKEVAAGQPTAVVVAGKSNDETVAVQHAFATERLRVYQSDDVVGVEVGGALKNVVAIAAGAADGFGFGHNARAGLITRGLAEIARIAMVKGGSPLTLAGLSGLGDLVLTCTGELSRNRTVGYEMGRGRTLDDVLTHLGHVAEGVKTAKSAYDLGVKLDVDMPITTEVYRVLYEQKPALQAVVDLMNRSLRKE